MKYIVVDQFSDIIFYSDSRQEIDEWLKNIWTSEYSIYKIEEEEINND